MFYHIEGKVSELEPSLAVIDCGGIGFALNVTARESTALRRQSISTVITFAR